MTTTNKKQNAEEWMKDNYFDSDLIYVSMEEYAEYYYQQNRKKELLNFLKYLKIDCENNEKLVDEYLNLKS